MTCRCSSGTFCAASVANWDATCGRPPRRRWSGCAPTPGRATSASCRASSSRRCCGPGATSSCPPSFRNHSEGSASAPAAPSGKEPGVEEFLVRLRLGPDVRELYAEAHRNLDRLLLPRVLEHTGGSQHQAALILGIARQTLRLKLRDLGLSAPRSAEAEGDPG